VPRSYFASVFIALFVAACGTSSDANGPDSDGGANANASSDADADGGGATSEGGAATDGPFVPVPHSPPPALTLHTTKVLPSPQAVTVTYNGFTKQDSVESFGDFIVASQWWTTVGAEYGVGKATHVKKARLTETAPAKITDSAIQTMIQSHITDATFPAPSATNNQLVFLVYFPQGTMIDDGTGTLLCVDQYSGYHAHVATPAPGFDYAVLPDCDGMIDSLTSTASHEFIETATDADDAWYMDVAAPDPWFGLQYAEVGDLCEWNAVVREGPWGLQRSWSMAAAAAGKNPCVPTQPGASSVLIGTNAAPETVASLKPGGSTTFTLTGWSTAPMAAWPLHTLVTDGADFEPVVSLSAMTIENGGTVTATLTVPAKDNNGNAVSKGQMGSILVYSGADFDLFTPLTIVLQ
jgi:hypothetical protein